MTGPGDDRKRRGHHIEAQVADALATQGLRVLERVLEIRAAQVGRALTEDESRHIRFAFQMANGLINNSIVNRPGPIMPGTPEFEVELVRGLKAVAGVK